MIRQTYNGAFVATHRKGMPDKLQTTFQYAVGSFGFLVGRNESISLQEWKARILRTYAPSARIDAVLHAIDAAIGCAPARGAP